METYPKKYIDAAKNAFINCSNCKIYPSWRKNKGNDSDFDCIKALLEKKGFKYTVGNDASRGGPCLFKIKSNI
jgi:hypothetical protein